MVWYDDFILYHGSFRKGDYCCQREETAKREFCKMERAKEKMVNMNLSMLMQMELVEVLIVGNWLQPTGYQKESAAN